MTLEAFLAQNKIRPSKLAADINVPASSISRLLTGARSSTSLDLMVKIMIGTSGQVTPNDFAEAYMARAGLSSDSAAAQ